MFIEVSGRQKAEFSYVFPRTLIVHGFPFRYNSLSYFPEFQSLWPRCFFPAFYETIQGFGGEIKLSTTSKTVMVHLFSLHPFFYGSRGEAHTTFYQIGRGGFEVQ